MSPVRRRRSPGRPTTGGAHPQLAPRLRVEAERLRVQVRLPLRPLDRPDKRMHTDAAAEPVQDELAVAQLGPQPYGHVDRAGLPVKRPP